MCSKQQYAVVTGANRGLGKAIAQRLIGADFHVALVCRRLSDAKATMAELGPGCCLPVQLDFAAGEAQIHKAASHITRWLGNSKLKVVVNNAGNSYGGWDEQAWEDSRLVNYKGPVSFTEALLPSLIGGASATMVGSGLGDLHLLSPEFQSLLAEAHSIADVDKIANRPMQRLVCERSWVGPYGLSKALLHRATEILADDERFRGNGIRVNAVCPGWVCTDMGGDQAPITVEEGACHILERAFQPRTGVTGTFKCYCYKNYDEEHNDAWEKKHGPSQVVPDVQAQRPKKRRHGRI